MARKAYEAEGRLAVLVDSSTYADSYGVPGSDFMCCYFCDAGGAPNVPFEYRDSCPIKTLEGYAQSWFDADRERDGWLDEETAARKSAEAALTALRQRVVEVVGPFAELVPAAFPPVWGGDEQIVLRTHLKGDAASLRIDDFRAARALINEIKETTDGR